jgi:hypothetical protein
MNRAVFLHRIKGPVILLVFGITALLDQWHILSYGESWPLYLIAIGLLQLAERAAWSQAQVPPEPYPGGYTGQSGNWGAPAAAQRPTSTSLAVPPLDKPRGFGPEDEGRR